MIEQPQTQVPLWRKIVAGILGVAGSVTLIKTAGSQAWKVSLPILALVAAAILIHRSTLGPQLLARAIWWSNLGLGALLCVIGGSSEREGGMVLTAGCGFALLVISRKGLAEASERAAYAPAAFRSSLLLLMVLALADAQTFVLLGIVESSHDRGGTGLFLGLAGLAFIAGFVGLYRIQVWGAIVNAVTALVVMLAVGSKIAEPSHELGPVVLVFAGVQFLAALPMLLNLFAKVRLPSAPAPLRGVLANVVVVLVMGVSLYFLIQRHHF